MYRRNHWPKAKDIEFQHGFSHPLASSRRAIDPQVLGGKVTDKSKKIQSMLLSLRGGTAGF